MHSWSRNDSFGEEASSSVLQHPIEMVPKEVANIKTIQVEAGISEGKSEAVESITVCPVTGLLHSSCAITYCPGLIFNVGETFHSFGRFVEARSICLGDPSLAFEVCLEWLRFIGWNKFTPLEPHIN